ncbi:MAG TPA: hypothetical protein VNN80_21955 [Polyangiaceae bacterium]|nr:hypothetical protein [Polyangiaceae bacterium]
MNGESSLARRHLRFGWYALAAFSLLGVALELAHAFKLGVYLDVGSEMRRLMWRLGHAHGTLLALVNIAFGCAVPRLDAGDPGRLRRSSASLMVAALLIPLGFLLGGAGANASDPGALVALVPAGAVLLVFGAASAARSVR